MQELSRIPLDTTTIVFFGYPDAVDPQTPLFKREGVLELVCSKAGTNNGLSLFETPRVALTLTLSEFQEISRKFKRLPGFPLRQASF